MELLGMLSEVGNVSAEVAARFFEWNSVKSAEHTLVWLTGIMAVIVTLRDEHSRELLKFHYRRLTGQAPEVVDLPREEIDRVD